MNNNNIHKKEKEGLCKDIVSVTLFNASSRRDVMGLEKPPISLSRAQPLTIEYPFHVIPLEKLVRESFYAEENESERSIEYYEIIKPTTTIKTGRRLKRKQWRQRAFIKTKRAPFVNIFLHFGLANSSGEMARKRKQIPAFNTETHEPPKPRTVIEN